MTLSIFIINYNTGQLVKNCIESIYDETTSLDFQITVFDNASKEDIEPFLRRFANVKIIKHNKNLGFGAANNIGINQSKSKYILLLNSDTILLDNCIERCIEYMNSHNQTGLLGCKLLNEDLSIQKSVFLKSSNMSYFINSNPLLSKIFKVGKTIDYSITQNVVGVSGAFMLFRRSVYSTIKPFDPDFFMFSEETELCRNRVSKYFDVTFFHEAKCIHLGGRSAPKNHMYFQAMLSNALAWYKKGVLLYTFYLAISLLNLLSALIGYFLASPNGKKDLGLLIKGHIKISKYLFFDIPKYPRKWGGRPFPLKLKKLN